MRIFSLCLCISAFASASAWPASEAETRASSWVSAIQSSSINAPAHVRDHNRAVYQKQLDRFIRIAKSDLRWDDKQKELQPLVKYSREQLELQKVAIRPEAYWVLNGAINWIASAVESRSNVALKIQVLALEGASAQIERSL